MPEQIFNISIRVDRKRIRLKVEQLPSDESFDYFKIIAKNKTLIFRSNGPVLRRHKLKYKNPDWVITEGALSNITAKSEIIRAINMHLKYGNNVPVVFEYHGKIFRGILEPVMGAGDTSVYHLSDSDGFYNGRLQIRNGKWVFDPTPKTQDMEQLAQFFGNAVADWTK